ncbi:MBL fold metallo-hydrolase [Thermoproteota archaeon]
MLQYSDLKISWVGHDCFIIKGEVKICTDPFKINGNIKADIILITHSHFDHFSLEDIRKISSSSTIVVAPQDCKVSLEKLDLMSVKVVKPDNMLEVFGINIKTVSAYNINKFRSQGILFHPKQMGGMGYIFKIGGVTFYHTGDTDCIHEMQGLNVDVMFLPVSGTYVMTSEEAVQAVGMVKPKLAIPMHFGSIVGSIDDAKKFSRQASCRVEILDKI